MSRQKVPGLLSLIYVHNPFYLISACLFVYGLKLLFRAGDSAVLFQKGSVAYMEPWGLMSSFAGVTVLMAVTAILIVRLGKVWEDARSLVLVVLLMLLAISVSFDEIMTVLSDRDNSRQHLFLMFTAAGMFALTVAEVLIRGLGIRLAAAYRLPLYAFLLLFFFWPALLLRELTGLDQESTRLLITAFPLAAAVITLCLLPAVRQGSQSVKGNGTPWSWPLFPWTPFVFISIAVLFRSFALTMSYDTVTTAGHYWDTTFGLYALVPFLLAICVLLLQMGLTEKRPRLQRGVLLAAPLLLVLSYPWLVPWSSLPTYRSFTYRFTQEFASPVYLTIIGLIAFYGYAWLRKVRSADLGFYGMVFLAVVISPRSFASRAWQWNQMQIAWVPLLIPCVMLLIRGFRDRKSESVLGGLLFGLLALYVGLNDVSELREWRMLITMHAGFLAVVVVGYLFQDAFAESLRILASPGLSAMTLYGLVHLLRHQTGPLLCVSYAVGLTLLGLILYFLVRDRRFLVAVLVHVGLGISAGTVAGMLIFFRAQLPEGTKPVALAIASFLVAVMISILKSGLSRRLRLCWLNKRRTAH